MGLAEVGTTTSKMRERFSYATYTIHAYFQQKITMESFVKNSNIVNYIKMTFYVTNYLDFERFPQSFLLRLFIENHPCEKKYSGFHQEALFFRQARSRISCLHTIYLLYIKITIMSHLVPFCL